MTPARGIESSAIQKEVKEEMDKLWTHSENELGEIR